MNNDNKLALTIACLYIDAFDKHRDRLKMCLHEDATLNWFGRTLNGSEEIIAFINVVLPCTIHYVYQAKAYSPVTTNTSDINSNQITACCSHTLPGTDDKQECNPISDRKVVGDNTISLKRPSNPSMTENESKSQVTSLINMLAGTEEVNVVTNYWNLSSKMLKLTPNYGYSVVHVRSDDNRVSDDVSCVKGIIIKANLYLQTKKSASFVWQRKIEHIYVEYVDNCIKNIVYKGGSSCRKNLMKILHDM